MKKIVSLLSILLLGASLAGCGTQQQVADANADGHLTSFAKCAGDKGLKMYGTSRCTHCQKMKAMFGSAFSHITFIDCDEQKIQCDAARIAGYPTWEFQGQQYQGEKTLEDIAKITSCSLSSTATGSTTGGTK